MNNEEEIVKKRIELRQKTNDLYENAKLLKEMQSFRKPMSGTEEAEKSALNRLSKEVLIQQYMEIEKSLQRLAHLREENEGLLKIIDEQGETIKQQKITINKLIKVITEDVGEY